MPRVFRGGVVSHVTLIPEDGFCFSHAGVGGGPESVVRSVVWISGRKMSEVVVVPKVMS